MAYDTDEFRGRYRAAIHPFYSAWLHGGFVALFAAAGLGWFASRIADVQPLEWLAVPAAAVVFSWGEYTVHRSLGHRKHPLGKLFYKRHTGDHHSFFVSTRMPYEESRDFRVILFPAWLVVIYTGGLALPAYALLGLWNANVGALVATTLLGFYLLYEFLHTTQHLPDSNPLTRLPWIRHMRRHHQIHHRRGLMTTKNFNLVLPLMDVLCGTLEWDPDGLEPHAPSETADTAV